jgi:hypothetical protein
VNALQEEIHYSFIKFCIYFFSFWYEFFVHYALRVENNCQYVLVAGPLEFQFFFFFGRGNVSPTHSELCRFVLVSQAKHQVSSPVTILLKKLFASVIAIMSWQDVTRSSLYSGVKERGTNRAHNFLFPKSSFRIRRTTVLGMFKDSAIILDAIRRSCLTKPATAAMFTSVRVDFGRPILSSSSTSSLPYQNGEYQLKTFESFRALFP